MFLAGSNFALHYHFLQGKWDAWWKDGEFRVYFSITTCCTFIITILLLRKGIYSNIFEALRYAAFQVVSIITTTGFVTADYELWPIFTQFLLLILMFIGGCAGSTSGGIKNLRIMVLVRHAYTELYRLLHPKAIIHTKIGDRTLSKEIVGSITAFFLLYIGLFTLATLLMTGLGLDLVSAISSVAATLGNIGPGLAIVGPTKNYALIPDIGKWILSFCMLLGRLELYTVLILCVPATWRR
jgi:trk system potassium uptake protein TrkH